MKHIFFLLLFFGFKLCDIHAQSNSFFWTLEDYYRNKPIPGVTVMEMDWKMYGAIEGLNLKEDDEVKWVLASDFPSSFFTLGNVLCRVFKGSIYFVLLEGEVCYYLKRSTANVEKTSDSFSVTTFSDYLYPFYSQKIGGEIRRLSKNKLKILLSKYDLFDQYDYEINHVTWKGSTVSNSKQAEELRIVLKFIALYNEKSKQ